ncbi:MAG: hypothetical protein WA666_04285 [Nitrospirota bacterium]
MRRTFIGIMLAGVLMAALTGTAFATPSTQVWIPSTDIQPFKTLHLDIDDYIRTEKNPDGTYSPIAYDAGITAGVLPFDKIQAEIGVDYIRGLSAAADDRPVFFNAKLATPEDSFFKGQPAFAVGSYDLGYSSKTNYAISYALAARTFPIVGRISAGWYIGNAALLKNQYGNTDNNGVLLSWDRTMTEISDKLWMAVDYQGGDNLFGALNFGVSWNFTKNVAVIVGYDIYNRKATGGQPTFNTQLDVNFP